MAAKRKTISPLLGFILALCLFPGSALALPPAVTETRPDPPPKNRQIVMLVVDGLQADALNTGKAPNISGLAMAGVRADRVVVMPPDCPEARLLTMLSGTDPADHGYIDGQKAPGRRTIMSLLEARGLKSAVIDGTGRLEKACGEVSLKNFGPFRGDAEVIGAALEVVRNKRPFFTLAVLSGPARELYRSGKESKDYLAAVGAADGEVGKFFSRLHSDGIFDDTMLVVTGTTGRPPLIVKGTDFFVGTKLPPVSLKELAPTLGYVYGIDMPEAKGLIAWNALRPMAGRTENFMLFQRVKDLSLAYADVADAAARLENEKILVQEEKSRLARDKKLVEEEIETREKEISRLKLSISAMKLAGLAGLIIFVAALVAEYRILRKRYLIFT